MADSKHPPGPAPGRLASLDAYRGFVMLAMASAGLGIPRITHDVALGGAWDILSFHTEHVLWRGCSAWDLIQPSFLFLVGAALPFSDARRRAEGQSWGRRLVHALGRSAILVALGVFLASNGRRWTYFTFTNVLAQIGLGYPFVFLIAGLPAGAIVGAIAAILVGDWALFRFYPLPGPGFEPIHVGLTPVWRYMRGTDLHWEKNINVAAAFDRWFLNLFPHPDGRPFLFNEGGYTTLNFVPSIATMLLGVLAGRWLRAYRTEGAKVLGLALIGGIGLLAGEILDENLVPKVKRIWTPSWVIYSGGWAALMLAAFYAATDLRGTRRWAYPLTVVGKNSIAIYLMYQLLPGWIAATLRAHVGTFLFWLRDRFGVGVAPDPFAGFYGPMVRAAAVLGVLWVVCVWMDRRRLYLKI